MNTICLLLVICASLSQGTAGSGKVMRHLKGVRMLPLASCNGAHVPRSQAVATCLSLCPEQASPYTPQRYRVYDMIQKDFSQEVMECSTYEIVQVFTETWTGSRIASNKEVRMIQVNDSACLNLFLSVCGGKPCEVSLGEGPEPEYSWASSVEVRIQRTIAQVELGTVFHSTEDRSETKITLLEAPSGVHYAAGAWIDPGKTKSFLWNKEQIPLTCPFHKYTVEECLSSSSAAWCPRIGMFLSLSRRISVPSCQDPNFYVSNKCYFVKGKSDDKSSSSPYLYNKDPERFGDQLIHEINEAFRARDTPACISSCLRLYEGKSHPSLALLYMAGFSYWRDVNETFVEACSPEFACSIDKGYEICTDPLLVKVTCSSGRYWWNPEHHILSDNEVCVARRFIGNESLNFPIVDGTVKINTSGVYLLDALNPGSIQHPLPLSNPHGEGDLSEIHAKLISRHSGEHARDSGFWKRELDKLTMSFPDWIRAPIQWVRDLRHEAKVIVIGTLITGTSLYFGLPILKRSLIKGSKNQDTEYEMIKVPRRHSQDESSVIHQI